MVSIYYNTQIRLPHKMVPQVARLQCSIKRMGEYVDFSIGHQLVCYKVVFCFKKNTNFYLPFINIINKCKGLKYFFSFAQQYFVSVGHVPFGAWTKLTNNNVYKQENMRKTHTNSILRRIVSYTINCSLFDIITDRVTTSIDGFCLCVNF